MDTIGFISESSGLSGNMKMNRCKPRDVNRVVKKPVGGRILDLAVVTAGYFLPPEDIQQLRFTVQLIASFVI